MAKGIENTMKALANIEGAAIAIINLVKPGMSKWEKFNLSVLLTAKITSLAVDLTRSVPEVMELDVSEIAALLDRAKAMVQAIVEAVQGKFSLAVK